MIVKPKYIYLLVILFSANLAMQAQKMVDLPLSDLSNFQKQNGNWVIVGDVFMDRNIDVHHNGNSSVITKAGKGIIVNLNDESKKSPLLTAWDHGDIDMELEFMVPKGSNSGIYLQGRYEVQLFDSWGIKNPKFSDLGGIFRNWESEEGKIYMGKAPLVNAAKAPGLWQKMYISFKAPRFDAQGKKIANAKLNKVQINGLTIHENLEIPLPTGGPIENNERAKGPLMVQGDHGAVAFRNIKYRLIEDSPVTVSNVVYQYWKGPYQYEDDYKNLKPAKSGKSPDGITWEMAEVKDYFALHLTGDVDLPFTENYFFNYIYNGNMTFLLDGKEVLKNTRAWDWDKISSPPISLTQGKHKFDIYFSRADAWVDPNLAIFVESDRLPKKELHTFSSYKVRQALAPILVKVKDKPVILRAFLDFKKDRNLRRTHTIGVGDPSATNYIFDNDLGALSCIWKGDFVDATPMWNDRGDGSFQPIGDVIYLDNTPQLDIIADPSAAFANAYKENEFKSSGYKINEATGTPIFRYTIKGMDVTDALWPNITDNSLTREISISNKSADAKFRIAHGNRIEKLSDGSYFIDSMYYITTDDNSAAIRSIGGQRELVSTLPDGKLKYSLIW